MQLNTPCPPKVALFAQGAQLWRCLQSLRAFNRDHQFQLRSVVFHKTTCDAQRLGRHADVLLDWDPMALDGSARSFAWTTLSELFKLHDVKLVWLEASCSALYFPMKALCESLHIPMLGYRALTEHLSTWQDQAIQLDIPQQDPVPNATDIKKRLFAIPVLRDGQGQIQTLNAIEIVEDGQQTLWEEMPPVGVPAAVIDQLHSWSFRLMELQTQAFSGSLRFRYETRTGKAWFVDVRSQLADHEILLEEALGIDAGKIRLYLATGGTLPIREHEPRSHFISLSWKAQARHDQTLRVDIFRPLLTAGVQMESWIREGDSLTEGSSVGKLLCRGNNRVETLERVMDAIKESKIILRGGFLVKEPYLRKIGEILGTEADLSGPPRELFVFAAGLELYREHIESEESAFYRSASRGRPLLRSESAPFMHLTLGPKTVPLKIASLGADRYQIRVQSQTLTLHYRVESAYERSIELDDGSVHELLVHQDSGSFDIELEGFHETIRRPRADLVRAPGPGVIQSIKVNIGDRVQQGQTLLTLEAMKMELAVTAPCDGIVQQVFVVTNTPALRGSPLLQLESTQSVTMTPERNLAGWSQWLKLESESRRESSAKYLQAVLLGYDVELEPLAFEIRRFQQYLASLSVLEAQARIDELLTTFTDVKRLFRKHPHPLSADELDHFATEDHLITYLRNMPKTANLPLKFLKDLRLALQLYDVDPADEKARRRALYWLYQSKCAEPAQLQIVQALLEGLRSTPIPEGPRAARELKGLQNLQHIAQNRFQSLYEFCLQLKYDRYEKALFAQTKAQSLTHAEELLAQLEEEPHNRDLWQTLIEVPYPLGPMLLQRLHGAKTTQKIHFMGLLINRYYCQHQIEAWQSSSLTAVPAITCQLQIHHRPAQLTALYLDRVAAESVSANLQIFLEMENGRRLHCLEIFLEPSCSVAAIKAALQETRWPESLNRVTLHGMGADPEQCTFLTLERDDAGKLQESVFFKNLHPGFADRLQLERWSNFTLERLPSAPSIFLFRALAQKNPKDERFVAMAEVRDLHAIRDNDGHVLSLPHLEHLVSDAFASIRAAQMERPRNRLHWNVIELRVWPVLDLSRNDLLQLAHALARGSEHLGLEKLVWRGPVKNQETGAIEERCLEFKKPSGMDLTLRDLPPTTTAVEALTEYQQKVVKLRQRSLIYPYELIRMFCPDEAAHSQFSAGQFQEYDLVEQDLVAVNRPFGQNRSNIVVGTIRHRTARYPEGMLRVILLGDPSRGLGNLAEPECRRIITALELAESLRVPVEWFALSSGARIAMDSGTENMDWIAAALRKIVDFTQKGGEINIVVMGINVGAQPYWNAEATMLMHTRGILIMLPHSAMVLTGKRALDYSGGVSAEDDLGIGGYARTMGINGQAQYFARDVAEACALLLKHYEHGYVAPGERFPRSASTQDPLDRDVRSYPHGGEFSVVGQVFSDLHNPGRKKPFEIRQIMRATIDQDRAPLERWADMLDAENAVVWDAQLGGYPVCLLGIESKPMHRKGAVHADGPEQWTGGTLFPMASKKIARAINAASGVRPLVVLANLSGFDGSPESMRLGQLEFGAEIGRAVVNFAGPIVFCVVSRFHGGAYVVFSKTLNDNLQILALEGTYASVIGGAPAAGVVFAGDVELRAQQHPDVVLLQEALKKAEADLKKELYRKLESTLREVRAFMVGQIADEFDREHSVQRALQVGSLHRIIAPERLRPELIAALDRGIARELERWRAGTQERME